MKIYGLERGENENCRLAVSNLITNVGIPLKEGDIATAHPLPRRNDRNDGDQNAQERPLPVIVQFSSAARDRRDEALKRRKQLKGSKTVIYEDLTEMNSRLMKSVKSDIRLFADDTSLYIITDDIQESAKKLNIDLQEINKWAKKWLVNFNPTKTESLLIKNKKYSSIPPLVFDGKIVTEVNSHKHLGIIITTDLTWTAHIDAICSKALKRLDILRVLKIYTASSSP